MTATETLAIPQQRAAHPWEERSNDDDDEEDPISSIKAMSITVGDHDSSPYNVATTSAAVSTSSSKSALQPPPKATSSSLRSLLGVPPSSTSRSSNSSSLLGVPPSTSARTAPAGIGGASGAQIGGSSTSTTVKTLPSEIAPKRRKVILGPGCSALDWAKLKSTIPSQGFRKIRPSELKLHNTKQSAWSAFNGKVYDMTPYLRFHPGGEDELMRVAGRDGTKLFSERQSLLLLLTIADNILLL
jgi:hypothetical protein